ncbi:hypothetical protein P886_1752 [Alteromonadaceae bacterium 2753L.S.0a.02]|nr:hypothetical protein P886_1752 [Alteromonadaceae bacterium 2753L.S.0a.02]
MRLTHVYLRSNPFNAREWNDYSATDLTLTCLIEFQLKHNTEGFPKVKYRPDCM